MTPFPALRLTTLALGTRMEITLSGTEEAALREAGEAALAALQRGTSRGQALDRAAAVLRARGIDAALVRTGTGEAIAIGAPPGERGWRVPLAPDGRAGRVTLRNEALCVAQRPRQPMLIAVIGPSARLAETWSTTVNVLGGRAPHDFPRGYQLIRHHLARLPRRPWRARATHPEFPSAGIVQRRAGTKRNPGRHPQPEERTPSEEERH